MASKSVKPSTRSAADPETLIKLLIEIDGTTRRFRLPLKDFQSVEFNTKVESALGLPAGQKLKLERLSDTIGDYVDLEPSNHRAYKQLPRAAEAKGKVKIRATRLNAPNIDALAPQPTVVSAVEDKSATTQSAAPPPPPPPPPHFTNVPTTWSMPIRSNPSVPAIPPPPYPYPLVDLTESSTLPFPFQRPLVRAPVGVWQVYCNECDRIMADEHYHCSICENGDYDVCTPCINSGKLCPGEDHWLVKRSMDKSSGLFVNSTTERIPPKPKATAATNMPGSFEEKASTTAPVAATRTCNSCVRIMAERLLLTCTDCEDHDLCVACFQAGKHGHHPGHRFKSIASDLSMGANTAASLAPGRNVAHAAICDGCNKKILGVRHKCFECPDWDFCETCFAQSASTHPGHRFASIYEPLDATYYRGSELHYGILCDGPLCKANDDQKYISGVRFKCAICNDVDFCANCEAHPRNQHNKTHPLIKFKTHIRSVSVTTLGEDGAGRAIPAMGDQRNASAPPPSAGATTNAAPREPKSAVVERPLSTSEKFPRQSPDSSNELLQERSAATSSPIAAQISAQLDAEFVSDTMQDGSNVAPSEVFWQTWVMRNNGPNPWPIGCSVRFVGGDHMLNMDRLNVASVDQLTRAQESNRTDREVLPGNEFSFSIQMRAPTVNNTKLISYWRLRAPDGTRFGHKLWCDIKTKGINLADYQLQLNLLEEQNKKRLLAARRELDAAAPSKAESQPLSHEQQMRDLNHQLRLLEEHGRQRVMLARQAADRTVSGATADVSKGVPSIQKVEASTAPIASESETSSRSNLVFPSLEKESPASSVHEHKNLAQEPIEQPTQDTKAASVADTTTDNGETFEDVLESDGFSSSDEAFLTDDEYDILDASDEETNGGRSHS